MLTKSCGTCREAKPLDMFHRNKNNRDGLTNRCKPCACAVAKAWKAAQPKERIQEIRRIYRPIQNRKRREKYPEKDHSKDRARLAALYLSQKDLFKTRAREWKRANPEKHKVNTARYAKAHPLVLRHKDARRRARLLAATVGPVNYERIYERDNGTCWMCGSKPEGKHLHFDHVIPISKGGPHTEENLRVACATCNLKKGARILPLAA